MQREKLPYSAAGLKRDADRLGAPILRASAARAGAGGGLLLRGCCGVQPHEPSRKHQCAVDRTVLSFGSAVAGGAAVKGARSGRDAIALLVSRR
jgi:hypothetical protein